MKLCNQYISQLKCLMNDYCLNGTENAKKWTKLVQTIGDEAFRKKSLRVLIQNYAEFRSKSNDKINFLLMKLFSVSSDTNGWLRLMNESLDIADLSNDDEEEDDRLHLHRKVCALIHIEADCSALSKETFNLLFIYTTRLTRQLKFGRNFVELCEELVCKLKPKTANGSVSALVDALIRDYHASQEHNWRCLPQIFSVIEDLLWRKRTFLSNQTLDRLCVYLEMLFKPWQDWKEMCMNTNLFQVLPEPYAGRVYLRMIDSLIQELTDSSKGEKQFGLHAHKHLCWTFSLQDVKFTQTITDRMSAYLVRLIYQSEDWYIAVMVRDMIEIMPLNEVQHIVLKLIDTIFMDELDLDQPNWGKQSYMCELIENVLSHFGGYSLNAQTLLGMSQYFIKLIRLCKRQNTVQKAVFALQFIWLPSENNLNDDDECFLMKLIDSSMAELSAVPDWTNQRNMCWIIENVLRFKQNVFVLSTGNVLRVFDYLMALLGAPCLDRETILWAILAMERLLMYSNNVSLVDDDRMGQLFASLTKFSKSFKQASKLLRSQTCHRKSRLQLEIGLCASWCIDNVLCAVGQEDNRFGDEYFRVKLSPDKLSARNDTYGNFSTRSSFGVTSGVYYYEAIVLTSQQFKARFGWCTVKSKLTGRSPTEGYNIGGDQYSIGLKIFNGIYHNNVECDRIQQSFGGVKMDSEECTVVGCLIDVDKRQFAFYQNGNRVNFSVSGIHFSSQPYFAAATLTLNEQCYFNFGQTPFFYPPKDVQFSHFHGATNGEARQYQLVDSGVTSYGYHWFKRSPLNDQIVPLYRDSTQKEYDKVIKQLEFDIQVKSDIEALDELSEHGGFRRLRKVQSIIEVIGGDELDRAKFDIIAKWIGDEIEGYDRVIEAKLCELVYPYLKLQNIDHRHAHQHRTICMVVMNVIKSAHHYPQYPIIEYIRTEVFHYLVRVLIESCDNWTILFALIAIEFLHSFGDKLRDREKKVLSSNSQIVQLLNRWNNFVTPHSTYEHCLNAGGALEYQIHFSCQYLLNHVLNQNDTLFPNETIFSALSDDRKSEHLKLSLDLLSARSDYCGRWQSVRSVESVSENIYYFETVLLTNGEIKIGWATRMTEMNSAEVGDDEFSVAFDGFNRCVRHESQDYQLPEDLPRWKAGDVIGCLIDAKSRQFRFSLNGQPLPLPSDLYFSSLPYHVSVSLSTHQQCYFNFGQSPFRYPPRRVDYWDFHLRTQINANKRDNYSLNLSNAQLNNSFITIASTNSIGNISYKQDLITSSSSSFVTNLPNKKVKSSHHFHSDESVSKFTNTNSNSARKMECRLCTEQTETKLVRFVCCLELSLCLDCVKLMHHCTKCAKQPNTSSNSSEQVHECRLCLDQSRIRVLQFVCCNNISLCLDCVQPMAGCPKCSRSNRPTK